MGWKKALSCILYSTVRHQFVAIGSTETKIAIIRVPSGKAVQLINIKKEEESGMDGFIMYTWLESWGKEGGNRQKMGNIKNTLKAGECPDVTLTTLSRCLTIMKATFAWLVRRVNQRPSAAEIQGENCKQIYIPGCIPHRLWSYALLSQWRRRNKRAQIVRGPV